MLITFLSFLPPEHEMVWQRPTRWTRVARSHPKRNRPFWKRHSSTQRPCVLVGANGYMSNGDPRYHSIALFQPYTLDCPQLVHTVSFSLSVSDHSALFLSLSLHSSFHSAPILVSERIFAYLPSYSHIFLSEFWEMRSPRQMIHIDSQCSVLMTCQSLQLSSCSQNVMVCSHIILP